MVSFPMLLTVSSTVPSRSSPSATWIILAASVNFKMSSFPWIPSLPATIASFNRSSVLVRVSHWSKASFISQTWPTVSSVFLRTTPIRSSSSFIRVITLPTNLTTPKTAIANQPTTVPALLMVCSIRLQAWLNRLAPVTRVFNLIWVSLSSRCSAWKRGVP